MTDSLADVIQAALPLSLVGEECACRVEPLAAAVRAHIAAALNAEETRIEGQYKVMDYGSRMTIGNLRATLLGTDDRGGDEANEREMAYAWGRDEERAAVVTWLRDNGGVIGPSAFRAAAIEQGEHRRG